MTFTVKVAGHETRFPCEPREFVLDAAERAGYSMPSSCRKGACNTCEAGLLDGEVEQRGRGRRTARDGTALMCRAQPRADLVIRPKRFERIDIFRRKIITARIFRLATPASDVTIVEPAFPDRPARAIQGRPISASGHGRRRSPEFLDGERRAAQ